MSEHVIIIENTKDWPTYFPNLSVVPVKDYLTSGNYPPQRRLRIINMCRSYSYASHGYYCSLLAEARGHRVIPTVRTIQDLSRRSIYSLTTKELDDQVEKAIVQQGLDPDTTRLKVVLFFGHCDLPALQDLAQQLFEGFKVPILQVDLKYKAGWHIAGIRTLSLKNCTEIEQNTFLAALKRYITKPWRKPKTRPSYKYDLAILHDPKEKLPPSDSEAIQHFISAAKESGLNPELIQKRDYVRLAEYDALFIRETTQIDHHTFRFARRAQKEGLVVVDDPDSILRCTNKVFLEELLRANRVPTPKTLILSRGQEKQLGNIMNFPIIVKIPDGSFSRGVYKVQNNLELFAICKTLFKESDLILAQEYMYTEFDWRIGILDRKPLFVCKYLMSAGHWQIYNHDDQQNAYSGDFETLSISDTPPKVIKTALRAAKLIGDGLYGVDLKQTPKGVYVIEVNDNPNIDGDVEDKIAGHELYLQIMQFFLRRLEQQRN
ncbi:carboxylate--amine ligase [Achromatium sp. WMS2]|nr:carboxylate--amine ligase [Achromatium sp. WMS2]